MSELPSTYTETKARHVRRIPPTLQELPEGALDSEGRKGSWKIMNPQNMSLMKIQ